MHTEKLRLAELINGRAAMIGCYSIGLSVLVIKSNLLESLLSENLQQLWKIIGVYANYYDLPFIP